MLDRDYGRSPHPPTCTCVTCTERRSRRSERRFGHRLAERGGSWGLLIGAAGAVIAVVIIVITFA